jgi:hypothetical protein
MRKSTIFLITTAALGLGIVMVIAIVPHLRRPSHQAALKHRAMLVRKLDVTDLCLFTEVRYTRHLSQTDLFSAFQESPMAFEHYPSGSMTHPPAGPHRGRESEEGR